LHFSCTLWLLRLDALEVDAIQCVASQGRGAGRAAGLRLLAVDSSERAGAVEIAAAARHPEVQKR
jgi:hypothetical protein